MDVLWKVYRENKGKMPSRKQRIEIAEEMNMKENQIYKWFWEIKHKQQDEQEMEENRHLSHLTDEQKFEVFVSKALKQYREKMQLSGWDGTGRKLTADEVLTSVKIHCQANKKEEEYEALAKELGFDTD